MKLPQVSVGRAVAAAAVVSILGAGCVSSSSDHRPEVRPHPQLRSKTLDIYTPIDVNAISPTPTPHSMRKSVKKKPLSKFSVPTDTSFDVDFTLTPPSGFTLPATLRVKIWQIQVLDDGTWYNPTNVDGPLAYFTGSSIAYKNITFSTPGQTQTVSVTIPSGASGQQFFIGIAKEFTQSGTVYGFGGGQIFDAQ